MELYFAPPSWISCNVARISLAVESTQYGGPGLEFCLSQAHHTNPNPLPIQALRSPGLSTLQQMFTDGLARPIDVVSEWRRLLRACTSRECLKHKRVELKIFGAISRTFLNQPRVFNFGSALEPT